MQQARCCRHYSLARTNRSCLRVLHSCADRDLVLWVCTERQFQGAMPVQSSRLLLPPGVHTQSCIGTEQRAPKNELLDCQNNTYVLSAFAVVMVDDVAVSVIIFRCLLRWSDEKVVPWSFIAAGGAGELLGPESCWDRSCCPSAYLIFLFRYRHCAKQLMSLPCLCGTRIVNTAARG